MTLFVYIMYVCLSVSNCVCFTGGGFKKLITIGLNSLKRDVFAALQAAYQNQVAGVPTITKASYMLLKAGDTEDGDPIKWSVSKCSNLNSGTGKLVSVSTVYFVCYTYYYITIYYCSVLILVAVCRWRSTSTTSARKSRYSWTGKCLLSLL